MDVTPRPLASPIGRRRLLQLAGGSLATALITSLPGCSDSESDHPADDGGTPTTAPGQTTKPEPGAREILSSGGVLRATFVVAPELVAYEGRQRWVLAVNGLSPGPTLRVKPGDRLELTLDNRTGHPTNLHTHGLRVSPAGNADNPFIEVPNGTRFDYRIEIPADHPGGTFWFHPHFHHNVADQLFAGFYGMIIVEDAIDRLPELVAAKERLIALHDTRIGQTESEVTTVSMMAKREGRQGDVVFTGGERFPNFAVEAGKVERWRVLNASASRFYRLKLDGHQLFLIATDAARLASPRAVDELTLVPGERVELLVRPASAGSYVLRSLPVTRGAMGMGETLGSDEIQLATLTVSGSAAPAPLPQALAQAEDLKRVPAARIRDVVFSMQGQMGGAQFLIDGKSFDVNRIDIKVKAGEVEDWVVRNTSPMDHPFHLHVWPFQAIENSRGESFPPEWKDTINVPANSWVRLRIPFTGLKGKTVFHCHILDHEDLGMMATIEVA